MRSGAGFKADAMYADCVRLDCCYATVQVSQIQPEYTAVIPHVCINCNSPVDAYINPDMDRIERLALQYHITVPLAEFLYKAFKASDYISFQQFFATIKLQGLTPKTLVHRSPTYNNGHKKDVMQSQQYQLRLTIVCKDCMATFRVTALVPSSYIEPKYCVLCGSNSIKAFQDEEQNYFEIIAESYDTDTETIKLLIDTFGRTSHQNFADFVKQYDGVNKAAALCRLFVKSGFPTFDSFVRAARELMSQQQSKRSK